jgi:hypothetical protein
MRSWLLAIALLASQARPDDLPPDLPLILRIQAAMSRNLARLPNYTCALNIERTRRVAPRRKFELLDTVRLEVALVEGKELFGWPGADRIAEAELSNLVGGTIGNGDFALLAKSIFLTGAATFSDAAEAEFEGTRALLYSYHVPLRLSGYHLKVPPQEAVVGYHGRFWADPQSLDLLRLEVEVDDIPERLGLAAAANAMEYGRMKIGGADFLLPRNSELSMTERNGTESRNRTRFTACRQFTGESVLTFADPESAPRTADATEEILELPREFEADLSLETPIASATSAVGDPVKATLKRALKVHGAILIPAGAEFSGHIARLDKPDRAYVVDLAFTSVAAGSKRADLRGRSNTIFVPAAWTELRGGLNAGPRGDAAASNVGGGIAIAAGRLSLNRRFRFMLRSGLLKSKE